MEQKKEAIKVSVLIPVYNVEKYVRRCIDSVLHQTMQQGVEVIIVNDCTPDRSMEIIFEALRAYEASVPAEKRMWVRVVNHDTNRGLAAVRNTAMSQATGDYTIHVDSDDWVEPDMLEKMYAKAVEEDADIVVADYYRDNGKTEVKVNEKISNRQTYYGELIRGEHASLWNKMIRRKLYMDHSICWEEGFDRGEDYMILIQLFYFAHTITHVSQAFYHYIAYNPTSICHTISEKVKRNHIQMVEFAGRFLKEQNLGNYDVDWAYCALKGRVILLENSSGKEREQYFHLFPTANKYMDAHLKQVSWGERLLLQHHFRTHTVLKSVKRFIFKIVGK